jgi:hypothetical protein
MTNSASSTHDVRALLERYEAAGRDEDLTALGELFAPTFVAGGPQGCATVTRAMLLTAVATRRDAMRALGHDGGRLASVEETWLGPSYCLAVTTWTLGFAPPGRPPVTLEAVSDFVLHAAAGRLSIVTYLARQDLEAQVAAAGLG